VAQHPALELAQLGTRLEAELLVEQRSRLAVDLEGLSLAAGGVEAAHQLPAQPLAEGVLRHEGAQLGHDLALAPAGEIRLDAVFQHLQSRLLEPLGLAAQRICGEPAERRPAPQRERVAQERRRAFPLGRAQRGATLVRELLELGQVELVAVQPQRVAARSALDRAGREQAPQARDVHLHRLRRRVGRPLPELVDQTLERNRLSGAQKQRPEHGLLPGAPKCKRLPARVEHLEHPQNPVLHHSSKRDSPGDRTTENPLLPGIAGLYTAPMLQGRNGAFTIAQISDIHCGGPDFVPNLMERAVAEINDLNPDLVICSGDLTTFGFKHEYAMAKGYLDQIECDAFVVIPGNHDSRNVGYVHFEDMFGERNSVLRIGGVTVVAVDSTEPDLDHGQIGRGRYRWIEEQFSGDADLRIFVLHHHLLPVPGTGRERNVVYDAGDCIECLQRAGVDLVLSGHKHVPYAWRLENLFVVNAGTVSSQRLRGKTRPCYNVIEVSDRHVDVWRKYPFHGQERIIQFSTETRAFEKYTTRIEDEVTART
jgi:predicted phosphodiesterase